MPDIPADLMAQVLKDAPPDTLYRDDDLPICTNCCNGDRCDNRNHVRRRDCSVCHGTGIDLHLIIRETARQVMERIWNGCYATVNEYGEPTYHIKVQRMIDIKKEFGL